MIAGKGFLVLAAALLAGCAGAIPVRFEPPAGSVPGPAPADRTQDIFGGIPGKYRELAESAETSGDLRRALLYRNVVNAFARDDADARERVRRLERTIRGQVERHYRAGLAHEESGETAMALREFLSVLVLDPDHEGAFRRVKIPKNGMNGKNGKNGKKGGAEEEPRSWTVREGDTLRKIAAAAYRDPDKEFLVAYFNRLPVGSPLSVGTELRLPDVDTTSSTLMEKSPRYSRPEKESSGAPDGGEGKEVTERKAREADAHYEAGVRDFLEEDLDGAIREWGKALSLDPGHPKARRDMEKAQRLKGKIE